MTTLKRIESPSKLSKSQLFLLIVDRVRKREERSSMQAPLAGEALDALSQSQIEIPHNVVVGTTTFLNNIDLLISVGRLETDERSKADRWKWQETVGRAANCDCQDSFLPGSESQVYGCHAVYEAREVVGPANDDYRLWVG
jgi:hypothetical protein